MALPRLSRLLRCVFAPALIVVLSATVVADGAMISTTAEDPMPASRLPLSRPCEAPGAAHPAPPPPKSPCPHPHKCTGATGTARS
jgi:hypothetical protein